MNHFYKQRGAIATINQLIIDQLVTGDNQQCNLACNIPRIAKYGYVYNAVTAHNCIVLPTWDNMGYPSPTHCDVIPAEVLHADRRKLPRLTQAQAW